MRDEDATCLPANVLQILQDGKMFSLLANRLMLI